MFKSNLNLATTNEDRCKININNYEKSTLWEAKYVEVTIAEISEKYIQ